MYGFETWIIKIKKAERWSINAFELWCWRILLRVHWTARRSNQSILKEINPEYSLEGLMLKLKLQYFGHRMQRIDSLEKDLDAGKDWRQEKGMTEDERVGWRHWLDWHEFEQAVGVGDGPREARGAAVHGVAKSRTWLTNWNEWMIQGHRYLLFSGFSHHQLMWLQIECGTWITTLTSKGMRCFQTPGLHRARALPLTFHGLDLSSCESHCNQVVKLLGEECMKK